ncbi:MAG TPA: MTAP family purine nucleoside phosphorylase [Longimicrobiales bacterium]
MTGTHRPRLGIIGGSSFLDEQNLPAESLQRIATPWGDVDVRVASDWVFLRRHGESGYRPPHRIPHHAHVVALQSLGVGAVAGFASTGSLQPTLQPGDIVVPDDYISWHPPPTFAGDEYLHIVPALAQDVRALLLDAAHAAAASPAIRGMRTPSVRDGGVYVQTHGPRFETPAEVRLLAQHADLVGMTAASEATLCQERGMAYAFLCVVDNAAHGIGQVPLTLEAFQEQLARNALLARTILAELIRLWKSS